MAKRRKKSKKARPKTTHANQTTSDDAAEPALTTKPKFDSGADRQYAPSILVGVLVCLVVYLWLFYSTPLSTYGGQGTSGGYTRFQHQRFLISDPLFYFELWTGGDLSKCNLLDRVPIILVATLILGVAFCVGRMLLALIRVDSELTQLEVFVFAEGVGLNVLSLFTLAVGLVGGLHYSLLFVLPMGAVLVTFAVRRSRGKFSSKTQDHRDHLGEEATRAPADWIGQRALGIGVPFAVVILLGAMLPPRSFDVLEYHLQVPKEWYQAGRIDFMKHNIYGNMPLGAEMHALLAMVIMPGEDSWWWGALVGKTVIAAFAPLTALALFAAGQRFVSTTAGVVAALVYVSIPWVALVSMHGFIDGVFAFYLLVSVNVVLIWSRFDTPVPSSNGSAASGLLILSGFLAGAAVACKYPAILFVVTPLCIWITLWPRSVTTTPQTTSDSRIRWKPASVFLLAVVCGSGLWFGKNWVLAGNPTYPLLSSVFGGKTLTPEKIEQWNSAHEVPKDADGRSYSASQIVRGAAQLLWKSDWLSPLLIPFATLALLVRRHRRTVLILLGFYVYIIVTWWLFTHRIDRFWIPVLPIVALMAGIGVTWTVARVWQRVVIGIMFLGLLFNLQVICSRAMDDVRFFVALEELRRDEPQPEQFIPSRMHWAHRFLNERAADEHKVMLVGNAAPFDLKMPALYNTCFDECVFTKLMKGKSRDQRIANLRREKVAYIFVDWRELERHRSPGGYGYSSDYVQIDVFEQLVEQGVLGTPEPHFPLDALGASIAFGMTGASDFEFAALQSSAQTKLLKAMLSRRPPPQVYPVVGVERSN